MAWGAQTLLLHGKAVGSWTLDNPKQELSRTGLEKNSSVKTKKYNFPDSHKTSLIYSIFISGKEC